MNTNIWLAIIISVITAILMAGGYYMFNEYGKARESKGSSSAVAEQAVEQTKVIAKDRKELERIHNESKVMDKQSVINDLSNLGVMRNNEDY